MARRVRIRRVIDGDSLEVKYGGLFSFLRKPFPVRLYGIDAPELAQPYGQESRKQLETLVRRGGIRLDVVATDRYGRTVGLLYRRRRAQSVNVEMVRSGMAWWYRRYGGRDLGFPEAEAEAKRRRRGVWRHGDRIRRPWDYRADLRRTRQRRGRIRRVLTWMLIGGFAIALAGLALAIMTLL
ncbi:MAG: thermonuclease family protein [Chloroflexi bacterium]|nr:thermonuclease family protein [Chloroflexota bacterium]